jgi:hypothetical protein
MSGAQIRALEFTGAGLADRFRRKPTGVVDQYIDPAKLRHGGVRQGLQLIELEHIRGDSQRLRTEVLDLLRHLFEIRQGARTEHDPGAGFRQRPGNPRPDALACAGNHRDLAIHPEPFH